MKKIIIAFAAIAAAFTFASCEKDNTIQDENNGKTVLYASTADAALTRAELSGNDTDGYQILWEAGDVLTILNSTEYFDDYKLTDGAGTTEGTFECLWPLTSGVTYDAYYPAAYITSIANPATYMYDYMTDWVWNQTYVAGTIKDLPMSAQFTVDMYGKPSPLKFKNEGGILRLKVKNEEGASLKSITISSGDELTSVVNNANKSIVLDCGTSGVALSSTGAEFLIAMPAGEYSASKFQILFTSTDGKTKTMTMASKPMVITRSQITAATISVSFAQKASNALPYAFEINSNGDKVVFSKGNLYWDGNSFGFEDDQLSVSSDYVTKFFYSNSASVAMASSYSDASAASTDVLFTNATETTAKADFTVAGETGKWRVLSEAECMYLRNKYDYSFVYVEGNGAMILYPEGVSVPSGINQKEMTSSTTLKDKFANLLAKDCVLLPMRWDEDWYWTSTSTSESLAYSNYIAVKSSTTQSYGWMIGDNTSITLFDLRPKALTGRIRLVMDYSE